MPRPLLRARRLPAVAALLAGVVVLAPPATLVAPAGPTAASAGGSLSDAVPTAAAARRSRTAPGRVVSRPVAFRVTNTNRTAMPCRADGASYVLRGRIVAQRRELLRRPELFRVFLHVHDLTTGGWFWNLGAHPRFDHARRMARLGNVSVVLDRLGYDGSGGLVDGAGTCLGAQADMLHQVVQQLRSGRYAARVPVRRAGHVVTVGHSVGAAIAQLEAATWRDVPGVVQMSWTNQGPSSSAAAEAADQHRRCAQGGDRVQGRRNYAFYGTGPAAFRALLFHSAPPAVQRTATRLRNPDPCGDAFSLSSLVTTNNALAGEVRAKLLLLYGEQDALHHAEARGSHRASFTNADEVDEHVLPSSGSALPLEADAAAMREVLDAWACRELSCAPRYHAR